MKKLFFYLLVIGLALSTASAEDASKSPPVSDRRLTHEIHTAIVADSSLSYCAHIVNVQADKGKVTLQGKVHTEDEKEAVGEKAAALVGEKNVTNEVAVKDSLDVAVR